MDPDALLMIEFQKGDISAFEKIITKYKQHVINLAYRFFQDPLKAEDMAHEVFLKVYRSAKNYQPKAKLFTWIYKITTNLCLNELRAQKRHKTISMERIDQIPDAIHPGPEESYEKEQMTQRVKEAVASLPDRQRMVVLLKKYDELSYEQISKIMNCSISAVDSLMQRAKQSLKQKLSPFFKNNNEGF